MPDSLVRDTAPIVGKLFKPFELLVFALSSLAICGTIGATAVWMDIDAAKTEFRREVDTLRNDIARRFSSTEAVLTSLVGLQQASDAFNKHQFGALSRAPLTAYPFIRTISEIGAIPRDQRAAFEDAWRMKVS